MQTIPPNPFKGLRPYEQDDQDKLFGRDHDLILMKDRIFSCRTTLLFAGSGVGKTSFLNAKVIPELKEQYTVVWHSRWTGTDELDEPKFSDEEKVTWRHPFTLLRAFLRKFSPRKKKTVESVVQRGVQRGKEQQDDALNVEVKKALLQTLRHEQRKPGERSLLEVLSRFKKPEPKPSDNEAAETSTALPASDEPPRRCILILDQFEEVFQYHAYEKYFSRFLDDICQVINDDSYQVRVVFSMREEFLGELSAFDNRIPDLFNNYYRLKYPNKADAKLIIKYTCALEKVKPDNEKLDSFVEDLSKIKKGGGNITEHAVSHDGSKAKHIIKRDFVAPPYLQIACERLWNQQYAVKNGDGKSAASGNGDKPQAESKPVYPPFLADYQTGDTDDKEPGGGAQRALRSFCEERLSEPFMTTKELDLASRAFDFLVTKQGAKMAYELTSLADHMDAPVAHLKLTLEKLSDDETHILRESRGPDRSYWFELYHDMYATIVEEWKRNYQRTRKAVHKRVLLSLGLTTIVLTLLIGYSLTHFLIFPLQYRSNLVQYKESIKDPDIMRQEGYLAAFSSYNDLKETFGWRGAADSLWADIWERRAQLYERAQDRDAALLSLLKAAELRPRASAPRLQEAAQLIGNDYRSLVTTYCNNCTSVLLSPDGRFLLARNKGNVKLLNAASGELISTLCEDCSLALFSADSKAVLTFTRERKMKLQETESLNPITSQRVKLEGDQTPPAKPTATPTTSGVETTETSSADSSKAMDAADDNTSGPASIKAVARFKSNYLIAGLQGRQLVIWTQDGKRFGPPIALAPNKQSDDESDLVLSGASLTFSTDGQYLAATARNLPAQVWKMTDTGAVRDKRMAKLGKGQPSFAFSNDGKLLLYIDESEKTIRLLNLESGESLPVPQTFVGSLITVGFSPDSKQYFTQERDEKTKVFRVWETKTGTPLYSPVNVSIRNSRARLGPDGKTILEQSGSLNFRKFRLVDTQTGRTLGTLGLTGKIYNSVLLPDGQSLLTVFGSTARRWKVPQAESQEKIFDSRATPSPLMSANGKTLATSSEDSSIQLWDIESGKALSPLVNHGTKSENVALSPDGRYVATADKDKTLRFWPVDQPQQATALPVADDIDTIAFSPDNNYLSIATAKNQVYVWKTSPASQPLVFNAGVSVESLTFSPDSKYLAIKPSNVYSEEEVTPSAAMVLNIESGREIKLSEAHEGAISDVKFGSSGKLITGSEDGTARIWNLADGRRLQVLKNDEPVLSVALSPGDKWALTGGEDGFVRMWDVATGTKFLGEWQYADKFKAVDFSRDGKMAIVLTDLWVHLSAADEKGVRYLNGRPLADRWTEPFSVMQQDGKKFRFMMFVQSTVTIEDLWFDTADNLKTLEGDPTAILQEWQKRLALEINKLGQIEKKWADETTPPQQDEEAATKPKPSSTAK